MFFLSLWYKTLVSLTDSCWLFGVVVRWMVVVIVMMIRDRSRLIMCLNSLSQQIEMMATNINIDDGDVCDVVKVYAYRHWILFVTCSLLLHLIRLTVSDYYCVYLCILKWNGVLLEHIRHQFKIIWFLFWLLCACSIHSGRAFSNKWHKR